MILWIEGIIGAGKTTLTRHLSKQLGLRPLYEPVDSNPYLGPFYEDPKRWAFPMQIELLHRRYALQKIASFEHTQYAGAILDRGLPGDRVFARMLTESGEISDLEWGTYERCYDIMCCSLMPPSLMLFLDVSPEVAMERIIKRDRKCETVSIDYLKSLHEGYMSLLDEIESGIPHWAKGIRVMRLPWGTDMCFQEVELLVRSMQPDLPCCGADVCRESLQPNDA